MVRTMASTANATSNISWTSKLLSFKSRLCGPASAKDLDIQASALPSDGSSDESMDKIMPIFHTDTKQHHEAAKTSSKIYDDQMSKKNHLAHEELYDDIDKAASEDRIKQYIRKKCANDQAELLKLVKDAQKKGFVKITGERERLQDQAVVEQQKKARALHKEVKTLFTIIKEGQKAGHIQLVRRPSTDLIAMTGGVSMKFGGSPVSQ